MAKNGQLHRSEGTHHEAETSESESEDEDGVLATMEIDTEINAVLAAIKNKDPRLKDKSYKWYKSLQTDPHQLLPKLKHVKPVTLRDYHRTNLLTDELTDAYNLKPAPQPRTETDIEGHTETQKGVTQEPTVPEQDEDDDNFFLVKEPLHCSIYNEAHPSRVQQIQATNSLPDPEQDPDGFLQQYSASRAWTKNDGPSWEAFGSDNDSEEEHMDEIEHAFNMRFENPEKSNAVIRSYIRDDRSVRRDKPTGRKAKREQEKLRSIEWKKKIREDKARLRRLKLEESQNKLQKIKEVSGISGDNIDENSLLQLLEESWDNDTWEREMAKQFNNDFYDENNDTIGSLSTDGNKRMTRLRKPKWDSDIDIADLVSDPIDEIQLKLGDQDKSTDRQGSTQKFTHEDSESCNEDAAKGKNYMQDQRLSRKEHALVEDFINSRMPAWALSQGQEGGFKYRETSPISFGMTARDILLAPSDTALNDFAGLKKYATWRKAEKKRQDRKKLGKKSRLRSWRSETFGEQFSRSGPTFGFEKLVGGFETKAMETKQNRDEMVTPQNQNSKSKIKQRRKNKNLNTRAGMR